VPRRSAPRVRWQLPTEGARCGSRTGSVRSAGLEPLLLLDARGSESTICVILRRRYGWVLVLALTRRVVQRVMGHGTAAMTMDLYGHLADGNLWQAARLVGTPRGHLSPWKRRSKCGRKGTHIKVPGNHEFSNGAAYRNRTDDLSIMRRIRAVQRRPQGHSRPSHCAAQSARVHAHPGLLLADALARAAG
jgi:hypothetical protein